MTSLIHSKNLPLNQIHRHVMILFTCWIFSLFFSPVLSQEKSADIILIAPSYTMNPEQPWADAVVIKGDKIIFVGDEQDAVLYQTSATQVIDMPRGMVLPGFIDSHVHL